MRHLACFVEFETDPDALMQLPELLNDHPNKSTFRLMQPVDDELAKWIEDLPAIEVKVVNRQGDTIGNDIMTMYVYLSYTHRESLKIHGFIKFDSGWGKVKTSLAIDGSRRDSTIFLN